MTEEKKPVIWVSLIDGLIHVSCYEPGTEESEKYEIFFKPAGKRADVDAGILRNILEEAGIKVKMA